MSLILRFAARLPLLLAFSIVVSSSQAGMLVLTNGDRIQGELMEIVDGTLRWKGALAGELEVSLKQVRSMESQQVFDIELQDGHQVSGCLIGNELGKPVLHCKEQRVVLGSVAEMVSLAPYTPGEGAPYSSAGRLSLMATDNRSGGRHEQVLDGEANVWLRYSNTRHRLLGDYEDSLLNGDRNRAIRKAEYSYDYFFRYRWYLSGIANARHYPLRDDEITYQYGPSIGHQWSETAEKSLLTELGVVFNRSYYDDAPDEDYPASRWKLDYRQKIGPGDVEIFHTHLWSQSFDTHSHWDLETQQGVRMPIYGRIQGILEYEYDRSKRESGLNDRYQAFKIGFGYSW